MDSDKFCGCKLYGLLVWVELLSALEINAFFKQPSKHEMLNDKIVHFF